MKSGSAAADDEQLIIFDGGEAVEILYFDALLLVELRVGYLSDFWEVAVEVFYFEVFEVWSFAFDHLNSNQINNVQLLVHIIQKESNQVNPHSLTHPTLLDFSD